MLLNFRIISMSGIELFLNVDIVCSMIALKDLPDAWSASVNELSFSVSWLMMCAIYMSR